MGFWTSMGTSVNSAVNNSALDDAVWMKFSGRTANIAKKLATYYKTKKHRIEVLGQIQNFIKQIAKEFKSIDDQILDAIVHAYITKNSQYPENFDTYIAMQYLKNGKNNKVTLDSKKTEWFSQKINEVEKHLERISLVRFQLTKNLKELESQGDGHLWIDHD